MNAHTLASSDVIRHILHNRPTMGQTKNEGLGMKLCTRVRMTCGPQITMCMLISTTTIPFTCFTVNDGQKPVLSGGTYMYERKAAKWHAGN